MGAINSAWHRYVYASIADHLHTAATGVSLPLIVEFLDKRDATWKAASSRAEATITGPRTKELSSGLHRIWVDVFIVLASERGANDYDHIDLGGAMANALDQCITVKDYGDTGTIDIGIIDPRTDTGDSIEMRHIKPKEDDDHIYTTLSARYFGLFSE